jgi:hypothetical protein
MSLKDREKEMVCEEKLKKNKVKGHRGKEKRKVAAAAAVAAVVRKR